jgi:uncharacterized protein (DUF952 family)
MTSSRQFVYKVLPRADWESACQTGTFAGSRDDVRDGFIHLSTSAQLPGTLARHFGGQRDLLLIQFETRVLEEALRWETSRGGEVFPHLYAPLPTAAATARFELREGIDGVPLLPENLRAC